MQDIVSDDESLAFTRIIIYCKLFVVVIIIIIIIVVIIIIIIIIIIISYIEDSPSVNTLGNVS